MRVRLLVEVSGTRNGQQWPPMGNEIDLPDDEARQMISAQQAVPVTHHRSVETGQAPAGNLETREAKERPLTTVTGPVPPRKGSPR